MPPCPLQIHIELFVPGQGVTDMPNVAREAIMHRILFLCFALLLPGMPQAEELRFGDWFVVRSDNGDLVAGVAQEDFNRMLVYRCFQELNQCAHVLLADIQCDDSDVYPILVNSDHAALSMNTICSENEGNSELVLSEFDAIHEILINASVVGLAVPMASGHFKVVRFSLNGSAEAMDYAERMVRSQGVEYL